MPDANAGLYRVKVEERGGTDGTVRRVLVLHVYRDGNARSADFRRAMEQASGRELGWFFDEWLTRGGMLRLRAAWSYDAAARAVRLDLEQLQAGAPYRMPIEVGLEPDGVGAPRIERVELDQARQSFTLPAERAPRSVVLDPRTLVLMDAEVARR